MQHGICALRSTAFDRCYYCHLVLSESCPSSLPHHRHRRRLPLAPGLYASSSLAARPPHGEYQPKKLRDSRAGLEFRTQERRSGAGRCYLRRALRTCCIEPAAGGRVREQALRRRGGATLRRFVSCRFMLLRASVNAGRAAALCGIFTLQRAFGPTVRRCLPRKPAVCIDEANECAAGGRASTFASHR